MIEARVPVASGFVPKFATGLSLYGPDAISGRPSGPRRAPDMEVARGMASSLFRAKGPGAFVMASPMAREGRRSRIGLFVFVQGTHFCPIVRMIINGAVMSALPGVARHATIRIFSGVLAVAKTHRLDPATMSARDHFRPKTTPGTVLRCSASTRHVGFSEGGEGFRTSSIRSSALRNSCDCWLSPGPPIG